MLYLIKLAKKLKVNDIEERTDAKKSKKVKRELETKRTKKTKNELKGIKKKDSKKEEKKIMNSSPVESTPSSTEIGLKPSTESKPIAEDAAKKLKREQKLKKIAKRKKKKEKLKKEIQAKKIERKMKTNSTSRVSTAVEDIDNTEGFNQEDFNEKMAEWNDMMLPHVLLRALYDKGFYKPMPIQKLVLPEAIKNRSNIIGTAQTGSGKTLAFGLPILTHMIDFFNSNLYSNENEPEIEKIPQALILTPTRELAIQIKEHLQGVCKYQKAKICVLVGGINQMKQERLIKQEPEIIVATPGRLMQLLDEGNDYLNKIGKIKYLVIDEADRMIEKGHFGEMEKILAVVNNDELFKKKRQNFLFSATLITKFQNDIKDEETIMKPKSDEQLQKDLKKALNSLVEKVQMNKEPLVYDLTTNAVTGDNLIESKLFCSKTEKDIYMYYFLSKYVGRTLVFCNSIDCVRRLTALFRYLKKTPLTLHANMEQKQRLKNLEKFNGI
jgi:ATP-dependent RNA helicase DDX24/MAK5